MPFDDAPHATSTTVYLLKGKVIKQGFVAYELSAENGLAYKSVQGITTQEHYDDKLLKIRNPGLSMDALGTMTPMLSYGAVVRSGHQSELSKWDSDWLCSGVFEMGSAKDELAQHLEDQPYTAITQFPDAKERIVLAVSNDAINNVFYLDGSAATNKVLISISEKDFPVSASGVLFKDFAKTFDNKEMYDLDLRTHGDGLLKTYAWLNDNEFSIMLKGTREDRSDAIRALIERRIEETK